MIMAETDAENKPLDDPLTAAQLEKLKLEIENLRSKSNWERWVVAYTPLFSILITVGGFLFGIYQFQRLQQNQQTQIIAEQEKDRLTRERDQAIRIQNQTRSDIEQILQFTSDKQQTLSKLTFLLEDLKGYLEINEDKSQIAASTDKSRDKKRNITITLVKAVVDDCDFKQHRDVNFAKTLIDHWEDYRDYLYKEDRVSLEYILYMYEDALLDMYHKIPSVTTGIRFFREESRYEYPKGYKNADASQESHFRDLVEGFDVHMMLLKPEDARERHMKQFQAATCNGELTEDLFGIKISRASDPQFFSHCPR
jgi:hypothetical protein